MVHHVPQSKVYHLVKQPYKIVTYGGWRRRRDPNEIHRALILILFFIYTSKHTTISTSQAFIALRISQVKFGRRGHSSEKSGLFNLFDKAFSIYQKYLRADQKIRAKSMPALEFAVIFQLHKQPIYFSKTSLDLESLKTSQAPRPLVGISSLEDLGFSLLVNGSSERKTRSKSLCSFWVELVVGSKKV